MKKLIVCLLAVTVIATSNLIVAGKGADLLGAASDMNISKYILAIYNQLDFKDKERLDFDVFSKAYHGYLNLWNAGKLNEEKQILTIADLSQSSCKTRLWIIDLRSKKVLINDYVAHGQGSGDEYARLFSNTENSHKTSIGFYVTGETYQGDHGLSLRLHGMDEGYNSAAFDRDIVVHGADYVNSRFIASEKRLGRSWGCPAVSNRIASTVINLIKDGTCMFLYYPQKKYIAHSYWLNKKIDRLPEDFFNIDFLALNNAEQKQDTNYIIVASPSEKRLMAQLHLSSIRQLLP